MLLILSLMTLSVALSTVLDATATVDPLTWLIYNAGALGVVFALLVTGQLRTKAEVTHLLHEIESKDKVIEAFQLQLTGHTLPALAQSARILEAIPSGESSALLAELRTAHKETAELRQQLEKLARGDDVQ